MSPVRAWFTSHPRSWRWIEINLAISSSSSITNTRLIVNCPGKLPGKVSQIGHAQHNKRKGSISVAFSAVVNPTGDQPDLVPRQNRTPGGRHGFVRGPGPDIRSVALNLSKNRPITRCTVVPVVTAGNCTIFVEDRLDIRRKTRNGIPVLHAHIHCNQAPRGIPDKEQIGSGSQIRK